MSCVACVDSSDDGEWGDTDDAVSSDEELESDANGGIEDVWCLVLLSPCVVVAVAGLSQIPPSVSADSAAAVVTQSLPEKVLSN